MASTSAPPKEKKLYTRSQVAEHNTNSSIWVIIHNKVYDLTLFLKEHPGGEEVLLEQAGGDSTEPFEDIGHSSDARQIMESYEVGELVEEERSNPDEKKSERVPSGNDGEDNPSGSWRSWLIPVALGLLATLLYRYFINTH